MNGVKGSNKDRIRSFKIRFYYNKKKQNKQEQEEKKKKQNKQEILKKTVNQNVKKCNGIFTYIYILLGFFFELFVPYKKEEKIKIDRITTELNELIEQVEKENMKKNLNQYEKQLEEKKKIIHIIQTKQLKKKQIEKSYQTCLQTFLASSIAIQKQKRKVEYQVKQEKLEEKNFHSEKVVALQSPKAVFVEESIEQKKPIVFHQNLMDKEPVFRVLKKSYVQLENPQNRKKEPILEYQKKPIDYKNYLKKTQKKIKAVKTNLDQLKQQKNKSMTRYYEIQFTYLLNQLKDLEKEYQEISKTKEFQELKNRIEFYQLDSLELLKSDEAIVKLIDDCEKQLYRLNHPKKEIIIKKEIKQEKKKETSKKEKTNISKKEFLSVEEVEMIKNKILLDLDSQMQMVTELPVFPKKKGILSKINILLSNVVSFLFPTIVMPNKIAGILTGSILVHNRMKTMKRILQQEEDYEYGEILNQIKNQNDCLMFTTYYLNTSLKDICDMKDYLYQEYPNLLEDIEIKNTLIQLNSLESFILQKQVEIEEMKEKQNTYQKRLWKAG